MSNECPYCHFNKIIKYCKRDNRQRYQCNRCKRTWTGPSSYKEKKTIQIKNDIFKDFANGSTALELAERYNSSERSIRRILENFPIMEVKTLGDSDVIGMDVTYFGRHWGGITRYGSDS